MDTILKKKVLMQFGKNLSMLRKNGGLSFRQLAQRCDVDHSQIGKIEKGQVSIQIVTLFELAKGLNVHPKELLDFNFDFEQGY